jgi:hypothetical protein
MKQVFAKKKLLLLSFLIPFALATAGYHLVYVCDAGVRGQWIDENSKNMPVEKALELEEERRWHDAPAWGVHALVVGLPVGLLSLLISTSLYWLIVTRRGKADDVA